MRSGLRKRWDNLYELVERKYRGYEYRKKAKIRFKRINGGYNCKEEYAKVVVPYWKKYGVKPKMIWYRLFSAESKKVDPRYIPIEGLFAAGLEAVAQVVLNQYPVPALRRGQMHARRLVPGRQAALYRGGQRGGRLL